MARSGVASGEVVRRAAAGGSFLRRKSLQFGFGGMGHEGTRAQFDGEAFGLVIGKDMDQAGRVSRSDRCRASGYGFENGKEGLHGRCVECIATLPGGAELYHRADWPPLASGLRR